MKRTTAFLLAATLCGILSGRAQAQVRPILTLTASPSASDGSCVSPCVLTYNIYRGTAAGAENLATPINLTPLPATTTSFTDTTAISGTYFYVARAVETSGTSVLTSANSNEVSFTFPKAPAPPGLAVKAGQ